MSNPKLEKDMKKLEKKLNDFIWALDLPARTHNDSVNDMSRGFITGVIVTCFLFLLIRAT